MLRRGDARVRPHDRHQTALGFDLLTYTRSVEESKALNDRTDPMVIISASGMAETGRILHHLRHNIENPRNTILIVSWQAPDTLGRRLADREREVRIFGETYQRQGGGGDHRRAVGARGSDVPDRVRPGGEKLGEARSSWCTGRRCRRRR